MSVYRSVIRLILTLWLLSSSLFAADELIDFRDRKSIELRRPVLIAHRGGVVTEGSPECSLTAIRLAAKQGYDMVELDIRVSSDGIPMVFHDATLTKACAKEGRVVDYTAQQLESISYVKNDDRISRLDTSLKLCRQLRLGVMLDLKAGRDSAEFLQQVARLLAKHELVHASITISSSPTARRVLKGVRFTPTDEEITRMRADEKIDMRDRFWFGIPQWLKPGDVTKLKASGALVFPAINTFRYPAKKHLELAKRDVHQLIELGADGFQIDSVYHPLFEQVLKKPASLTSTTNE